MMDMVMEPLRHLGRLLKRVMICDEREAILLVRTELPKIDEKFGDMMGVFGMSGMITKQLNEEYLSTLDDGEILCLLDDMVNMVMRLREDDPYVFGMVFLYTE